MNDKITVEVEVNATLSNVWDAWTASEHITNWYFASDEWHAPRATNDLEEGGKFLIRMEAKDGSFGFDLEGVYTSVEKYERISYKLADDREVDIIFNKINDNITKVIETFDPEDQNTLEMQRGGWQSILDNFKKYVEKIK